jgi:hypothetical protein
MGIVVPIISFGYMCAHDITSGYEGVLPASVLIMNALSMFWYQTLDAIDGK